MARTPARIAFALVASLLSACANGNSEPVQNLAPTAAPKLVKPPTPATRPVRFNSAGTSFGAIMPDVSKAMIRLDPRYADYLRNSHFNFIPYAAHSTMPKAIAFFDSTGPYTGINDFAAQHQKNQEIFAAFLKHEPSESRPNLGTLNSVLLILALANEYAHYIQHKAGLPLVLTDAIERGDTNFACALYAKNQHVSDIMSLDMMGRVLNHAHATQDKKLATAVRIIVQTILLSADPKLAATWVADVSAGGNPIAKTYTDKMAATRLGTNITDIIEDCDSDHGLPWVISPLPRDIDAKTETPIRTRLPQLVTN